jgi:hypothetical protein
LNTARKACDSAAFWAFKKIENHSFQMFALLLFGGLSLDPLLSELSERARAMSKRPRAPPTDEPTEWAPGEYDFDSISFFLTKRVIGGTTPYVRGYASASSVLAMVAPPIPPRTVFVDPDTQLLLQIQSVIGTDDDVIFYNITEQNPLAVFAQLRMRTSLVDTNCAKSVGPYEDAECGKVMLFNWDTSTDMPVPIALIPEIQIFIGGFIRLILTWELYFNGLTDMGINWAFLFNGTAGAGIYIYEAIVREFPLRKLPCIPIWGAKQSVSGMSVGCGVQFCIEIGIAKFEVYLPKSIFYYRTWLAICETHGKFATSGVDRSPLEFDITGNRQSEMNESELFEVLKGIKLILTPGLDAYLEAGISLGPILDANARLGVELRSKWTFRLSEQKCTCPYLLGGTSTSLYGFFRIPPIKVLFITLMNQFELKFPLFVGLTTDPMCIFSAEQSCEGFSSLTLKGNWPSYIISGFKFEAHGGDFGVAKFYPILEALDTAGKVYQNLALTGWTWKFNFLGLGPVDKREVPGQMIVMLSSGSAIQWTGSQKMLMFIPQSCSCAVELDAGVHRCALECVSVNVTYTTAEAQGVTIFREFEGTGTAFVSFKPSIPENSVLGAIIHSTNGAEEYQSPLLGAVQDDSGTYSSSTDFKGKAEISIELENMTVKRGTFLSLTFTVAGEDKLKVVAKNVKAGDTLSGAANFNFEDVVIPLTGSTSVDVSVGFANSESDKDGVTETIKLSYKDITTGDNYTLEKSTSQCDAIFRIFRSQPNVVFQFKTPLSESDAAVICRVYEVDGKNPLELELPAAEGYGIMRYAHLSYPAGQNVDILVAMPDLTPLCEHRVMDSGDFLIPFSDDTHVNTWTHVPFRRDPGPWSGTIQVLGVFKSTPDATCQTGVEMPGPGNRLNIGCLEPVANNETMNEAWVELPAPPKGTVRLLAAAVPPDPGDAVAERSFKLHIYKTMKKTEDDVYPSFYKIPAGVVFAALEDEEIEPFSQNTAPMTVECPHADFVQWVCGQLSPQLSGKLDPIKDEPGNFTGVPGCRGSGLQFISSCRETDKAFCEFKLTVSELSLLRYRSNAGVIEVQPKSGKATFLSGVSRQILPRMNDVARVYKSWDGPIEIEPISTPGTLKITATTGEDGIEISLELDDLPIPFSASKYFKDPDGFFTALQIRPGEKGFAPDVAIFTDSATVLIGPKSYNEAAFKEGIPVAKVLDLPPNFVLGTTYGTAIAAPKSTPPPKPVPGTQGGGGGGGGSAGGGSTGGSSKLGMYIGIGAGGGVLVIVVIIVVVCLRRKKEYDSYSYSPEESTASSSAEPPPKKAAPKKAGPKKAAPKKPPRGK